MKQHIKILVLTVVLLAVKGVYAQKPYNTAVGLRAGWTSGLTIKQSVGAGYLEGMLGVRPYNTNLTLLYEVYRPSGAANINWYFGAGGHLSYFNDRYYYYPPYRDRPYYYYYADNAVGIDGIIGVEFKVPSAPVAFSLDLKPFIEFYHGGYWGTALDPGLGIKVAF